jgi:hypothetical protein
MQFYWSLKNIPELSGLSSQDRGRVWRTAHWKIYRHWQVWLALVGLGLCTFIGSMLGRQIDHQTIGSAIGAVVGATIYGQVATRLARPYLRAVVADDKPH